HPLVVRVGSDVGALEGIHPKIEDLGLTSVSPTSSPKMTRMLGRFACAAAELARQSAPHSGDTRARNLHLASRSRHAAPPWPKPYGFANTCFQSFFMSTTVHFLAVASSQALSSLATCDFRSYAYSGSASVGGA